MFSDKIVREIVTYMSVLGCISHGLLSMDGQPTLHLISATPIWCQLEAVRLLQRSCLSEAVGFSADD